MPIDIAATGASLIRREVYDGVRAVWGIPSRRTWAPTSPPGWSSRVRPSGVTSAPTSCRSASSAWRPGSRWASRSYGTSGASPGCAPGGEPAARAGPLEREDITVAEILRSEPGYPAADDPRRYPDLEARVRRLRAETEYAIVFDFHYGVIRECQRLRGFAPWLMDLIIEPERAEAIMEQGGRDDHRHRRHALARIGDQVDVFLFYDDMGFQDRPVHETGDVPRAGQALPRPLPEGGQAE